MGETVQDVLHVVPGGVAAMLEELGAEHIVEFPDVLAHGPSRLDPKAHREARLDYWRGLYRQVLGSGSEGADAEFAAPIRELEEGYLSVEQLGSVLGHHAEERIAVIWSTPAFEDRLFLWMAFEAARRAEVPTNRLATAEPHAPVPPGEEDYYALRDLQLEEIAEGFDSLLYPEEIYRQAGAQLWQTFASGSPRKFAISIPHTEKFFPNIATIGEQYGWMFPSADGPEADRMQLSAFDAELLGALSAEEWSSPFDILGEEFVEQFHFVDDLAIAARLADWAEAAIEPTAVERREVDEPPSMFERHEFRRTERGDELLEEGCEPDEAIPILQLGDCRIYAGPTPWARVVESEHWWFERIKDEG